MYQTLWWGTIHYLPYQSEANSGAYDVQWHTSPGCSNPNKFIYWSDGSTLDITSTQGRDQQTVGSIISKYGITTHYTAGQIYSKDCYGGPDYNSYTYIQIQNVFGYPKIAEIGDSGGPCFTGNTGLGITHAVTDDRQWFSYMAINYVSGIPGLSVKTSP